MSWHNDSLYATIDSIIFGSHAGLLQINEYQFTFYMADTVLYRAAVISVNPIPIFSSTLYCQSISIESSKTFATHGCNFHWLPLSQNFRARMQAVLFYTRITQQRDPAQTSCAPSRQFLTCKPEILILTAITAHIATLYGWFHLSFTGPIMTVFSFKRIISFSGSFGFRWNWMVLLKADGTLKKFAGKKEEQLMFSLFLS